MAAKPPTTHQGLRNRPYCRLTRAATRLVSVIMPLATIILSEGQHASVTQICTLRFRDGLSVSAQLSASSPYEDCPVAYSGAVERLPARFEFASAVLLNALFRSFARELRVSFAEEILGSWDRFAGDDDEPEPPFEAEEHSHHRPIVDPWTKARAV